MFKKIDELIPDWKTKIHQNQTISKNLIEMLPIFKQLVKDRNIDGILEFYENVCTDTYDINDDRDRFFHQFLMQFCNMNEYTSNCENREPKTIRNYLCFKVVANRGKTDEYSFYTYFQKKELFESDYKYLSFLMYNNLTGLETYLYKYELSKPQLNKENEIQCNNIVLSFKLEKTENENLLYPQNTFNEECLDFVLEKFKQYGLTVRNTLVNGEDLTIIIDLKRTINLKCQSLKTLLNMVERELLVHFQTLHIYNNDGFFMLPGSINSLKKTTKRKNFFTYQYKVIENGMLQPKEFSFYRCYYTGTPFYDFPSAHFSEIASLVGFPKIETKIDRVLENRIRYTRVEKERLEDLDKLIEIRKEEITERFNFFRIMCNTLFYLGKSIPEILYYMNDRNTTLYEGISEECLLRILLFCKEDYDKYLEDTKNGVKYTNEKIVEMLHIRSFEQKEMKQLINKTEADCRERIRCRMKSKKTYEKTKMENNEKKENLKREFLALRQQNYSNKEIAELKQMDSRKVDRLIGKDNFKQDLDKKIIEMLLNSKTLSEICEELSVSESKVRKMRKELIK